MKNPGGRAKTSHKGRANPLMKRIPRELRKDLGKYIALFIFMSLMIGMVSGFLVADGSMIKAYNDSFRKFSIENGHFNCDLKLTDRAIRNIEDEDVKLYELFYKDKQSEINGEEKTIRIFKPRDKVNRVDVMEGRLPEKEGEIVLDRLFGENNELSVGDSIRIGETDLTVTGFVALSDYSSMFKNNSDMMFNASAFSVAVVTDEQFRALGNSGLVYCYAWRYEDQSMSDDEQQAKAEDLMTTVYENSMLGSQGSVGSMFWNMLMSADAFDDGDDSGYVEADSPLKEFVSRQDNQAIQFTGDDLGGDKIMFEWLLYIVTVVLAFAFAVTTRSTIEQEAKTIGTLRASGFTRKELLSHYIILPTFVTFCAAVVGNILGYTAFKYYMANMYYHSYSLPTYTTIWSPEALIKTTLVPSALVIIVELLLIGRTLSLPPLAFLRRDLKRKKQTSATRLPSSISFPLRYRMRVILQNKSTYGILFAGIFLASIIFLFGSLFLPLLHQFKATIQDSQFCNYQYILKDPADTDVASAEKYAVTTLENSGGDEITVYGVGEDSAYLEGSMFSSLKGNEALLSNGCFEKYGIEKGGALELGEKFTSKKYRFTAAGEYDYPATLAVFMSIDQFRKIFDLEEDYYSGYFSNVELDDISPSKIATVITQEDLLTTSNQLEDSMGGAFRLFLAFSIVLFLLMVYLLAKLVTDRNSYAISMLKILGYSNREAGRFYNSATGIMVVISLVLSGVLGIRLIRVLYLILMQSFNGWMTFYAAPWGIPLLIAMGTCCYFLVSIILMRRIRKIPMTDALKDQE